MTEHHDDEGGDRLAPVIPLFGGKLARASELSSGQGSTGDISSGDTGGADVPDKAASAVARVHAPVTKHQRTHAGEPSGVDSDDTARQAEEVLVRKLRARSLSVSEARQVLRGHDLDAAGIDDVIEKFCERGYLDDALLAEHLVISGIERKGQGRVALSRALGQRGLPREVIDTALGDLPDDDAERALEFARTKARSLSRLDFDTGLRRLMGQLARRGYGGSVAMTAARMALTEASRGTPSTGVRFVDSD